MSENPLQELMRRGESGAAGYNAYNRGTYVGADGKEHIRGPDRSIDFSSMTIGELQRLQHLPRTDPERVFAVGKYQMIPDTVAGAIRNMHLDPNQRFTPELQDRMFADYLIVQKRPAIAGYITGQPGVSLQDAQYALASEWASFGDPTRGGRGHYGGANRASITLEQSEAALDAMRRDYRASIERGQTPQAAWAAVTHSDAASVTVVHPSRTPHGAHPSMSSAGGAMADGALKEGERGPEVVRLQRTLERLGYRDAAGHHIAADGHFGARTHEALQAFQRDYGLDGKGIFGPKSQAALRAAEAALVTSLSNPNHALFEKTLEKVREAEHARGIPSGPHSDRIAAALTTELVRDGITRVDRVEFNTSGTLVRAVQVSPVRDEPGLNRATDAISARQASTQSIAESSRQLHEVAVNVQAQRQDPQFVQSRPHAAPTPTLAH